MQDVAVKVLTVQDFQDDQMKEFLREVCTINHMGFSYDTYSLYTMQVVFTILFY